MLGASYSIIVYVYYASISFFISLWMYVHLSLFWFWIWKPATHVVYFINKRHAAFCVFKFYAIQFLFLQLFMSVNYAI